MRHLLAALLLTLASRPAAAGTPANPTTVVDLQQGAIQKYPFALLYGRTTATGTAVLPISIDSAGRLNVNVAATSGGNGSTIYFPSGYTMPKDNPQGTTVYPSSGALFNAGVRLKVADVTLSAVSGTNWTGSGGGVGGTAAAGLTIGASASTSVVTYSIAVGASGGATITIAAGVQHAFAKLDQVESATDWVGSGNVSAQKAGDGSSGRIFRDAFYPLALDANGVARTVYLASASGRTLLITIWTTLYP